MATLRIMINDKFLENELFVCHGNQTMRAVQIVEAGMKCQATQIYQEGKRYDVSLFCTTSGKKVWTYQGALLLGMKTVPLNHKQRKTTLAFDVTVNDTIHFVPKAQA